MPDAAPRRVFISYSHDSPEHQDRVLALADRLRVEGVNASIDQYVQSPPEGWADWCEMEIRKSDFVLMVCTETYLRRVGLTRFGGHPESLARGAADAKNTSTIFAGVSPTDGRPRPCWT